MLTEDKGKLEIELLNANAMARKAVTFINFVEAFTFANFFVRILSRGNF
eukprot:UN27247